MTSEQAKKLHDSKFWEEMEPRAIATFQLWENKLCMPWPVFHSAIEVALGRPVWTHEFGLNRDGLKEELLGNRPPPSMGDILNLIPADKRVVVVLP